MISLAKDAQRITDCLNVANGGKVPHILKYSVWRSMDGEFKVEGQKRVTYKMDTGADVTVLLDYLFNTVLNTPLLGPRHTPLDVLGFTNVTLAKGE